jgi:hypothetical protein
MGDLLTSFRNLRLQTGRLAQGCVCSNRGDKNPERIKNLGTTLPSFNSLMIRNQTVAGRQSLLSPHIPPPVNWVYTAHDGASRRGPGDTVGSLICFAVSLAYVWGRSQPDRMEDPIRPAVEEQSTRIGRNVRMRYGPLYNDCFTGG